MFSYPSAPEIPGSSSFTGTLIHSQYQRNFTQYEGKTVMVLGASYTAEDVASISYKHGAKKIICSYRTNPLPWEWPEEFETLPVPVKIEGSKVTFKDGTVRDVDVIVLSTGFKMTFPFMEERFRMASPYLCIPDMLYKSLFFHSNNNLIYMGCLRQPHNQLVFDVQAHYLRDVIMDKIKLPAPSDQNTWLEKWQALEANCRTP